MPGTSEGLTEGQLSLSLEPMCESWALHTSRRTTQGWVAFTSICSSPTPLPLQNTGSLMPRPMVMSSHVPEPDVVARDEAPKGTGTLVDTVNAPSKGWLVTLGGQRTLLPHLRRSPSCAGAPGMLGKPPCRSTGIILDSRDAGPDASPPGRELEAQAVSQS